MGGQWRTSYNCTPRRGSKTPQRSVTWQKKYEATAALIWPPPRRTVRHGDLGRTDRPPRRHVGRRTNVAREGRLRARATGPHDRAPCLLHRRSSGDDRRLPPIPGRRRVRRIAVLDGGRSALGRRHVTRSSGPHSGHVPLDRRRSSSRRRSLLVRGDGLLRVALRAGRPPGSASERGGEWEKAA